MNIIDNAVYEMEDTEYTIDNRAVIMAAVILAQAMNKICDEIKNLSDVIEHGIIYNCEHEKISDAIYHSKE